MRDDRKNYKGFCGLTYNNLYEYLTEEPFGYFVIVQMGIILDFVMYVIQHCFICRPSNSTVSEDAGIEPRGVATLALTASRSSHSARSHLRFNCYHGQLQKKILITNCVIIILKY